jgi:phage terminase large subunit
MRSWTIARILLFEGYATSHRVLCTREIQKNIKESVHQLLKDQIELLGLSAAYDVYETEIRSTVNETKFMFAGLSDHTARSIKSYEGVTRTWCEEAEAITKRSWGILLPTIFRTPISQLLVSFNPDLETDDTYVRFVKNPPEDAIVIHTTYRNNPWMPEALTKERLKCKQDDPDEYDHVWNGKCRPAVEGAIFFKQIAEAERQGRICNIPYNPMLKVHLVTDIGKGNSLFVALIQVHMSAIQVIESIDGGYNDWGTLSADLKKKNLNWGKWWLPHDGYTSTINSGGKSTEDILKALNWDVAPKDEIVQLSVEEGIRNAKLQFHRMYFDKNKAASIVECGKRYRRHISKTTGVEANPLADEFAHGGDTIRYICCNADKMANEETMPLSSGLENYYQPSDDYIGI